MHTRVQNIYVYVHLCVTECFEDMIRGSASFFCPGIIGVSLWRKGFLCVPFFRSRYLK